MATSAHPPITRFEKFFYGAGDLASALYVNFFSIYLLYYFVELGGVAPAAMGAMFLIAKMIDAVTDPGMGAIADRTRSRWGRYRPYLLYGAVPYGILGALVFAAPDMSPTGMLIWAGITYTATMLAFTATNVPYSALMGAVSPYATDRESFAAYRMVFSSLAGLLVGIVGTTLVRELGGGDDQRGIMLTMFIIAAIAVITLWGAFGVTRERVPPAPQNGTIRSDLGVLLRTPSWIAVAVAATLAPIALASRAGTALFFFQYVVGDDGEPVFLFLNRLGLFYTSLAAGQIAGVILATILAKRFEKSHLLVAAGAMKASAMLVFYFLPLDAVWAQTFVQLFVGLGFGMMLVLSYSMFTDIAEYLEWQSGRQMTGLTISASIFAIKTGVAIGGALPGFVIALSGFVSGEAQSVEALFGIQLAFALIPAAAMIPAAFTMTFYGITREKLRAIEGELATRRGSPA